MTRSRKPKPSRVNAGVRIVAIFVLASQSSAGAAHQQPVDELERARLEFAAGRYAAACTLLRALVKNSPEHAPAWVDLGLCEAKLARKPAAKFAALQALRFGNERTRLNAYYNLWKLGVRAPTPSKADACVEVSSDPALECTEHLSVCSEQHYAGGNGGGPTFTDLTLGATHEKVRADTAPGFKYWVQTWVSLRPCDYALHFRPPWMEEKVIKRCVAAGHTRDECDAGIGAVLGDLERDEQVGDIIRLSAAERRRAELEQRKCENQMRSIEEAETGPLCVPIVYDACQRRVGVVCDRKLLHEVMDDEEVRPVPRYAAEEYTWQ